MRQVLRRVERVCTYFDLWGCVRFPGSSKVHGEFAVRQAWQGCPSSHLILLRLHAGHSQHGGVRMCSEMLTGSDHTPWGRVSESRRWRAVLTHLLSLNLRSLRMEVEGLSCPSCAGDMAKGECEDENSRSNRRQKSRNK